MSVVEIAISVLDSEEYVMWDFRLNLSAATFALGTCFFSPAPAMAQTVPSGVLRDMQTVFNGCISNNQIYGDVNITTSMFGINRKHSGRSFHPANGSGFNCAWFTWYGRPLLSRPNNNVFVGYNGPDRSSSAWDCSHTVVVYGVFKRFGSAAWQLVAMGFVHGKLENGQCTHSYSAAQHFLSLTWLRNGEAGNAPWVSVYGGTPQGNQNQQVGEIRVATYTWVHNDSMHPPSNVCRSDNCYFSSFVSAW